MTAIEALEKMREKIAARRVSSWASSGEFDAGIVTALMLINEAIAAERLADAGETKPEPGDVIPKVCGNCIHGRSTSLDDIRCYKATPYLPTGLHCVACDEWEQCGTRDNPRVEYLRRKIEEAGK